MGVFGGVHVYNAGGVRVCTCTKVYLLTLKQRRKLKLVLRKHVAVELRYVESAVHESS